MKSDQIRVFMKCAVLSVSATKEYYAEKFLGKAEIDST